MADKPPPFVIVVEIEKFPLGKLSATPNALNRVPHGDISIALNRHVGGDWGELDVHDHRVNERALQQGGRLCSVYCSTLGERFYIITEADRSYTTILMPEDY